MRQITCFAIHIVAGALLVACLAAAPATADVTTAPAAAGAKVANGKYAGTVIENGKPSKKEWVRFRVKAGSKVVSFRSRIWLTCYLYPNSYYKLPVVFKMPKAAIKKRKVDRSWRQKIKVEGDTETLKGRVQAKFGAGRKARGRISIDVANCASRLGSSPYWVPFRVRR